MNVLEFMECDTCRAIPGSPVLCDGCRHNRRALAAAPDLLAALKICERVFEGNYPWMVRPGTKWTQKEAREIALRETRAALAKARP